MINLFASDAVKKALAVVLVVSGGLAQQLPAGLAKTIATYVALVLGAGGIVSGGIAATQPRPLGPPQTDPPHFRVS